VAGLSRPIVSVDEHLTLVQGSNGFGWPSVEEDHRWIAQRFLFCFVLFNDRAVVVNEEQ
jgi:hypothetical protein